VLALRGSAAPLPRSIALPRAARRLCQHIARAAPELIISFHLHTSHYQPHGMQYRVTTQEQARRLLERCTTREYLVAASGAAAAWKLLRNADEPTTLSFSTVLDEYRRRADPLIQLQAVALVSPEFYLSQAQFELYTGDDFEPAEHHDLAECQLSGPTAAQDSAFALSFANSSEVVPAGAKRKAGTAADAAAKRRKIKDEPALGSQEDEASGAVSEHEGPAGNTEVSVAASAESSVLSCAVRFGGNLGAFAQLVDAALSLSRPHGQLDISKLDGKYGLDLCTDVMRRFIESVSAANTRAPPAVLKRYDGKGDPLAWIDLVESNEKERADTPVERLNSWFCLLGRLVEMHRRKLSPNTIAGVNKNASISPSGQVQTVFRSDEEVKRNLLNMQEAHRAARHFAACLCYSGTLGAAVAFAVCPSIVDAFSGDDGGDMSVPLVDLLGTREEWSGCAPRVHDGWDKLYLLNKTLYDAFANVHEHFWASLIFKLHDLFPVKKISWNGQEPWDLEELAKAIGHSQDYSWSSLLVGGGGSYGNHDMPSVKKVNWPSVIDEGDLLRCDKLYGKTARPEKVPRHELPAEEELVRVGICGSTALPELIAAHKPTPPPSPRPAPPAKKAKKPAAPKKAPAKSKKTT
jgi:hypothetical protein